MKNDRVVKFVMITLIIILFSAALLGCGMSQEAKGVSDGINAIGPVTLESGDAIQASRKAYNSLTQGDKDSIKNIDKLEEAERVYAQLIAEDLDNKILKACTENSETTLELLYDLQSKVEEAPVPSAITNLTLLTATIKALEVDQKILEAEQDNSAESYDVLVSLRDEANKFSSEQKKMMKSFNGLQDEIESRKHVKSEAVIANILSCADGDAQKAKDMIDQNAELIPDDRLDECLLHLGRLRAVDYLKENFITYFIKDDQQKITALVSKGEPILESSKYKAEVDVTYTSPEGELTRLVDVFFTPDRSKRDVSIDEHAMMHVNWGDTIRVIWIYENNTEGLTEFIPEGIEAVNWLSRFGDDDAASMQGFVFKGIFRNIDADPNNGYTPQYYISLLDSNNMVVGNMGYSYDFGQYHGYLELPRGASGKGIDAYKVPKGETHLTCVIIDKYILEIDVPW